MSHLVDVSLLPVVHCTNRVRHGLSRTTPTPSLNKAILYKISENVLHTLLFIIDCEGHHWLLGCLLSKAIVILLETQASCRYSMTRKLQPNITQMVVGFKSELHNKHLAHATQLSLLNVSKGSCVKLVIYNHGSPHSSGRISPLKLHT